MSVPEVYKASDLPSVEKQQSNVFIRDLNELLKNANSLISNIASLRGLQPNREEINTGAKIEKATDEAIVKMKAMNPESQTKPILIVNSAMATTDLIQRLNKLQDSQPKDATLSEAVELVKQMDEAGMLNKQVENWIKQFVEIRT